MVAFDAVGPAGGAGTNSATTPLTWTHADAANATAILAAVTSVTGSSNVVTAVTYGGQALALQGFAQSDTAGLGGIALYAKLSPLAGSNTVSAAFTGGGDTIAGSVSATGACTLGTPVSASPAAASSASVTVPGTTAGGLIVVCACFGGGGGGGTFSGTNGVTVAWQKSVGTSTAADNAVMGYVASAGGSQTVGFSSTQSDTWGIVAVELIPVVAPVSPATAPVIPLPPGWFPGADQATAQPGGIPFWQAPQPVTDPGAVIIPPAPQAAPFQAPLLPPGWFPGADAVATEPGGIPFWAQPLPAVDPGAVIPPPAPDTAGIPDWLPLPPGWFPGSQTVTVDPGGIPFYPQPVPLLPPTLPPGPAAITQILGSGTGQYWADQYGNPRPAFGDTCWPLIYMTGSNGGATTWQSDITNLLAIRAAQGYTSIECNALGNTPEGNATTIGKTWDGVNAFLGSNDPSQGLNPAYWQRLDLALSVAATHGITIFLNLCMTDDLTSGQGIATAWTNTQFTNYGNAVAARYMTVGNLVWVIGDDYFGNNDAQFSAILTGIRAAGDNRPIGIENYTESTSQRDFQTGAALPWGTSNAGYNWTYSYNVAYLACEEGYKDSRKILVMRGDGWYFDFTAAGDQLARQHTWWALSSGSRGFSGGTGAGMNGWGTALADAVNGSYQGSAGSGWISAIITYFTGLTGWHRLIPDTGNALITAGTRGTRATPFTSGQGSTPSYSGTTDTYVSGAVTAAGDLAVIYWARGASATITVNQALLGSPYTATWVDPASCATSAGTPGSTFTKPAGANSAGDHDWVLVLQSTSTLAALPQPGAPVIPLPPGWFPGADLVTTVPDGIPFWQAPQPTDQNAAGGAALAVSAGLATGTGTAQPPLIAIGANSGLATGTGTAQAPLAAAGANAGLASGTGTAQAPLAAAGASTGLATGTGTAQGPLAAIGANDTTGPAPGTGTAQSPATASTAPLAPPAPVIPLPPGWFPGADAATAQPGGIPFLAQPAPADPVTAPTTAGTAPAGLAAGTGTAQQPLAAIAANAGLASGTATAQQPVPGLGANDSAGPAPGTGTAQAPVPAIGANAGVATGTGAALDATVSTVTPALPAPGYPATPLAPAWFPGSDAVTTEPGGIPFWAQPAPADPGAFLTSAGTAPAGLATGTGTAQAPQAAIGANDSAGPASGTGTGQPPVPALGTSAGLASGTGTAQPAVAAAGANGVLATGTGAAQSPAAALAVNAGLASGTGTAQAPLAGTGANDATGPAAGAGTAQAPQAAVAVNAGVATGTGTAQPVTTQPLALPSPGPVLQLPPGWFPGSDHAATEPGGIPFYAQPGPADPSFASVSGTGPAGLAAGTGTAQQPVPAVAVFAGLATGTGTAQAPGPSSGANAGLSAGTGAAQAASLAIAAQAQAAQALAAALNATGQAVAPFTVGTLTASTAPGAAAGGSLTASDKRTGGPGG